MTAFVEKNFFNSGNELWYRHLGNDYKVARFRADSPIGRPRMIRTLMEHMDVDTFVRRTVKGREDPFKIVMEAAL